MVAPVPCSNSLASADFSNRSANVLADIQGKHVKHQQPTHVILIPVIMMEHVPFLVKLIHAHVLLDFLGQSVVSNNLSTWGACMSPRPIVRMEVYVPFLKSIIFLIANVLMDGLGILVKHHLQPTHVILIPAVMVEHVSFLVKQLHAHVLVDGLGQIVARATQPALNHLQPAHVILIPAIMVEHVPFLVKHFHAHVLMDTRGILVKVDCLRRLPVAWEWNPMLTELRGVTTDADTVKMGLSTRALPWRCVSHCAYVTFHSLSTRHGLMMVPRNVYA
jgi:hypothetical protein